MIEELRISNLGVIEQAHLECAHGLTAITGETGAGKTMAVTALQLLMGGKADSSKVRAGSDRAIVEGRFNVPETSPVVQIVREAGGDVEFLGKGQVSLILARHVPASGHSRAFAGGRSVPASVLRRVCEHLVTLHGQSDQLRLRSSVQQRSALDMFAGEPFAQTMRVYYDAWTALAQARTALNDYVQRAQKSATERMAMQMLVSRVDAVQPTVGEDEKLKTEALRLANVETLRSSMNSAHAALSNESETGGALEMIARARSELVRSTDPELVKLSTQLDEADAVVSDVCASLHTQMEDLNADPARLDAIHARRAQIRALERELGLTVEDMLSQAEQARQTLADLSDTHVRRAELEDAVTQAESAALTAATAVTKQRHHAATKLARVVNEELAALYMKDAVFSISVCPRSELAPWGADDVQFLLAPHQGSQPMDLGGTASGGEMSRIMLALEASLARAAATDSLTFIFDEIDAGIGGKSALAVGKRLAQLARRTQVLCVTHLAQVAAYADTHVVVEKHTSDQGACTHIRVVEGEEREKELARMLSGHDESHTARTHACELLSSVDVTI